MWENCHYLSTERQVARWLEVSSFTSKMNIELKDFIEMPTLLIDVPVNSVEKSVQSKTGMD